jgi:peptidase A4-like protein
MAVGVTVAWAVLGMAGSASAVSVSGDWYGYAVTGATYTSTTADWTMPAMTCTTPNSYIAIWTGLDGYSSDSVEQIGAEAYCSGSTPEYFGWYELYPAAAVDFSKTLKPGDSLTAGVSYSSSKFTLTLDDVTQGWTETVTKALAGAARSSAETIVEVPDNFSCLSAHTLAAFTGDTVDGTALGKLDPVQVTGGDPDIVVSPVSGKSFSVTCQLEPS